MSLSHKLFVREMHIESFRTNIAGWNRPDLIQIVEERPCTSKTTHPGLMVTIQAADAEMLWTVGVEWGSIKEHLPR